MRIGIVTYYAVLLLLSLPTKTSCSSSVMGASSVSTSTSTSTSTSRLSSKGRLQQVSSVSTRTSTIVDNNSDSHELEGINDGITGEDASEQQPQPQQTIITRKYSFFQMRARRKREQEQEQQEKEENAEDTLYIEEGEEEKKDDNDNINGEQNHQDQEIPASWFPFLKRNSNNNASSSSSLTSAKQPAAMDTPSTATVDAGDDSDSDAKDIEDEADAIPIREKPSEKTLFDTPSSDDGWFNFLRKRSKNSGSLGQEEEQQQHHLNESIQATDTSNGESEETQDRSHGGNTSNNFDDNEEEVDVEEGPIDEDFFGVDSQREYLDDAKDEVINTPIELDDNGNENALEKEEVYIDNRIGWFGFTRRRKSELVGKDTKEELITESLEEKELDEEKTGEGILQLDTGEGEEKTSTEIETKVDRWNTTEDSVLDEDGIDTEKFNGTDENLKNREGIIGDGVDQQQQKDSLDSESGEETSDSLLTTENDLNQLLVDSISNSEADVGKGNQTSSSEEIIKHPLVDEENTQAHNMTKLDERNSSDDNEKEKKNKGIVSKKSRKSRREKKRRTRMEKSLQNAFPWWKRSQTNDSDDETKQSLNETAPDESIDPPIPEAQSPLFPMTPSSSLIFIPSPPPGPRSINRSSQGMPSAPISPAEATLTSLISSLLPLIVRLLLLSLLSSSSLFGHNDMHVYSPEPSQHFIFERLNDRYRKDNIALKKALEHPPDIKAKHAWKFVLHKRRSDMKKYLTSGKSKDKSLSSSPPNPIYARTVIVMDVETMENDMDATVEQLRDSVSCILRQYKGNARVDMGTDLEVVVCIESPGGVVQDFGLAADQLKLLKEAGNDLTLTVCVDKIAASGGYMMACQASPGQLIAAPFAILGSIGVLRETINIHDVLEKYGVRPLLMKAGDAKAPLTSTTKVTEESLEMVQNNLNRVHDAFRDMVSKSRGEALDEESYERVTNGDVFLAKHAVEYGLVDKIMSSDEYILERIQAGDRVLKIHKYDKSRMNMRFSPLDLLLLKSNGILGRNQMRSALRWAIQVTPTVGIWLSKFSAAFGLIEILDKNFLSSATGRSNVRSI